MIRRTALFLSAVALLVSGSWVPARAAQLLVSVCHASVVVGYTSAVTKAPTSTFYFAQVVAPTCKGSIKPYVIGWGSDDHAVLACPDQNVDTGIIGVAWFDNTISDGIWYQAGSMYAQRVSARINSGEHRGTMQGLLVAKKPLAFVTCKGISSMTFDMTMVFTMYS